MERNRLGRSDVHVTELGFGGGPLGGLFEAVDDDTATRALEAAWDSGIRYFDTSPHYGIGQSERRVGALLRGKPRDAWTLSTKVGRVLVPQDPGGRTDEAFEVPATHRRVWDFTRDGVLRSVEDSLTRMGVDRIDVLYLHDAEEHFEDALRDGYPALAGAARPGDGGSRRRGDVPHGQADPAGRGDRRRRGDAVRPLHAARPQRARGPVPRLLGPRRLCRSPRRSSTRRPRHAPPVRRRDLRLRARRPRTLERARRLAAVCEAHRVPLPAVAMRFPLHHPAVAGVVVGMRSADEVRRNTEAYGTKIPAGLWSDLRGEGLLDTRAPVPAPPADVP